MIVKILGDINDSYQKTMSDKIQTDCVCHNSNRFPFANEIIMSAELLLEKIKIISIRYLNQFQDQSETEHSSKASSVGTFKYKHYITCSIK